MNAVPKSVLIMSKVCSNPSQSKYIKAPVPLIHECYAMEKHINEHSGSSLPPVNVWFDNIFSIWLSASMQYSSTALGSFPIATFGKSFSSYCSWNLLPFELNFLNLVEENNWSLLGIGTSKGIFVFVLFFLKHEHWTGYN